MSTQPFTANKVAENLNFDLKKNIQHLDEVFQDESHKKELDGRLENYSQGEREIAMGGLCRNVTAALEEWVKTTTPPIEMAFVRKETVPLPPVQAKAECLVGGFTMACIKHSSLNAKGIYIWPLDQGDDVAEDYPMRALVAQLSQYCEEWGGLEDLKDVAGDNKTEKYLAKLLPKLENSGNIYFVAVLHCNPDGVVKMVDSVKEIASDRRCPIYFGCLGQLGRDVKDRSGCKIHEVPDLELAPR